MENQEEASVDLQQLRDRLYRYGLRVTGSAWDAEDVAQDALIKVMRAMREKSNGTFSNAYLYRAVSNAWTDRVRLKANKPAQGGAEDALSVPAADDGGLSARELLEELAERLSPRAMVIVLLMDVFDFTAKETAEFLSSGEAAIQVALGRARRRLAKLASEKQAFEGIAGKGRQEAPAASRKPDEPFSLDRLTEAFRRRDPKAICRAYVLMTRRRIKFSKLVRVNGKLSFYLEDPDGNKFIVSE